MWYHPTDRHPAARHAYIPLLCRESAMSLRNGIVCEENTLCQVFFFGMLHVEASVERGWVSQSRCHQHAQ
jgi:hypothetical protein